jgi:hypothetical protein
MEALFILLAAINVAFAIVFTKLTFLAIEKNKIKKLVFYFIILVLSIATSIANPIFI